MEQALKDPKIDEALELINNSARERRDEIQRLIAEKYSNIKDSLGTTAGSARSVVQKNPWAFLGGAAAAFLIVGYFIGRSYR